MKKRKFLIFIFLIFSLLIYGMYYTIKSHNMNEGIKKEVLAISTLEDSLARNNQVSNAYLNKDVSEKTFRNSRNLLDNTYQLYTLVIDIRNSSEKKIHQEIRELYREYWELPKNFSSLKPEELNRMREITKAIGKLAVKLNSQLQD